MLVYVEKITERLIYTFDFIFTDRNIAYHFTNDWNFYLKYPDEKFSYTEKVESNLLNIQASSLLFDEEIIEYSLIKQKFFKEDCLVFEKISDPFASIFFILSRMEEYTVKQRDVHDRFQLKNSVLAQFSWSKKVICDRWAEDIINFLENYFSKSLKAKKNSTKLISTFDIDNTFAYKWKEGLRRLLSISKDYLKKDKKRILERKLVENGKQDDPYDTFEYIKSLKDKNIETLIFWLLGDYNKYDKNISANDIRHQDLIKEISEIYPVHLHPSYESNKSDLILKSEKKILESILNKEPVASRQHFLKLHIPITYKRMISAGFSDDYTLGFAEDIGFRAGTARAFHFFDLSTNSKTNLVLHPFAYMDGSLHSQLKLSPEEAKAEIKILFEEVKNYGGDFIFIWHNETINDQGKWKSWRDVFEFTLNLKDEI
jgi:hypothetical protein